MMRHLITCITMVLAVGTAAAAEAEQPRRTERTVQGSYGPYPAPVTGCNEVLGPWACLTVPTRSTERFFTARVTDTHGQPVYVEASLGSRRIVFCGQTKEPVAIMPGTQLRFHVGLPDWPRLNYLPLPPCPANHVKTTGTIRVTLSNQR